MAHSNQIREFVLTVDGVRLTDVYVGPSGMLTGSARLAQEAREKAERASRNEKIERQRLALESRRQAVESQIAALRADFSAEEATIQHMINQEKQREESLGGPGNHGPQPQIPHRANRPRPCSRKRHERRKRLGGR